MKKIALVTWSSKWIGKEIVIRLAKEGYIVFVTYNSDKKGGRDVVIEIEKLGGEAYLICLDVCSEKSVKEAFDIIKKQYWYLNLLVNNAGIEIPKDIENVTFNEWKIVTWTKIDWTFLSTKYALPLLKNHKNTNIINIISSLWDRPNPKFPAYCIWTAWVIAFTKAMAVSLGKYWIRTNAISPGATLTPMWDSMWGNNQDMWSSFAENNPMWRVSTTKDIANAVIMIINDESEYLNGNFIYMNGWAHLK